MTPTELRKPLPPRERDALVGQAFDDLFALMQGRADMQTMVRLSSLANLATAGMDEEVGKLDPEVFDPLVAQAKVSCEAAVIGYRASGYMQVDQAGLLALLALTSNYYRMLYRFGTGSIIRIEDRARELCGEAIAAGLAL